MKLSRIVTVCGVALVGCTGQIDGGGSPGPGPTPVAPGTPPTTPAGVTTTPPAVNAGTCSAATLAGPRAWRLTKAQIANTLRDVMAFAPPTLAMVPADGRVDGFANQSDRLVIAPLDADFYFRAGDEIASEVVKRATELVGCPMASLGTGNCLGDFVKRFGAKMWRRPLADSEAARLGTLFTTTSTMAGGPEAGLRNVVKALFMSPNFLYRTEVGDNQAAGAVTTLTGYELASSLSYMLWDSPPDDALLALAAQNKLRDPATLTAQAKRLLAAPKAPTALHSFLQQYLSIEGLPDAKKDPVYGMFDAQTAADLMEENRLFLNSVMFDQGGDHSFKTLLTAQYGFVNSRTAPIYGINNVSGANLVKTPFDATQRRGLFTLGSFMAAHADPDATSLVTRGRFIREQVLCSGVPDPKPGDAVFDPTKVTPDMTGREKFTAHSVNPACATCHTLFDAIGFAMENYDPIGRYRTTDHNKPIDPSGAIPLPAGGQLAFKNFVEMVDNLAKTPEVYSCFSAQYLSYATGRGRDQVADCEKQLVADQFVNSGYKLDNLILAVVNSPSFIARKN